jgi:hypothetical protein
MDIYLYRCIEKLFTILINRHFQYYTNIRDAPCTTLPWATFNSLSDKMGDKLGIISLITSNSLYQPLFNEWMRYVNYKGGNILSTFTEEKREEEKILYVKMIRINDNVIHPEDYLYFSISNNRFRIISSYINYKEISLSQLDNVRLFNINMDSLDELNKDNTKNYTLQFGPINVNITHNAYDDNDICCIGILNSIYPSEPEYVDSKIYQRYIKWKEAFPTNVIYVLIEYDENRVLLMPKSTSDEFLSEHNKYNFQYLDELYLWL